MFWPWEKCNFFCVIKHFSYPLSFCASYDRREKRVLQLYVCWCVAGTVFLWGKYPVVVEASNMDGNKALCAFDIYVQCEWRFQPPCSMFYYRRRRFSSLRSLTRLMVWKASVIRRILNSWRFAPFWISWSILARFMVWRLDNYWQRRVIITPSFEQHVFKRPRKRPPTFWKQCRSV